VGSHHGQLAWWVCSSTGKMDSDRVVSIDQEVVVHHLLEVYSDGQTLYEAYEKLEQCCKQGNEKVFKFKICLEELFWTLAKTVKFTSSLLPSLNRKLSGKGYSSLAYAVEAAKIEEQHLGEAERSTHGEDWEQQKQHGRGRRVIMDNVASRKRATRAGNPWRGLKAKGCW